MSTAGQPAAADGLSPYQLALGDDRLLLHPRLADYFSRLPDGAVGRGHGVFDVVGTPRRWLWPVLAVLARRRVLAPTWQHGVPFTVENRRLPGPRETVAARRTFAFPDGSWTMVDAVAMTPAGLVDALGDGGAVRAAFTARVEAGALVLASGAVGIRIGRLRLRVPAAIAPRVNLVERFDDVSDRQHVAVTVDAPLIGRIYEYSGHFDYAIHVDGAVVGGRANDHRDRYEQHDHHGGAS